MPTMVAVVTWALAADASGNAASPASSATTTIERPAMAGPGSTGSPRYDLHRSLHLRERIGDHLFAAGTIFLPQTRCQAEVMGRRLCRCALDGRRENTCRWPRSVGYIERAKDKCAPRPSRTMRVATRGTTRAINRRIALNLIRTNQPISRADLARLMGTRRGAVSLLVEQLIDDGDVFEGATGEAKRGRKPTFLYIDSRKRCVVAVDIRTTRTFVHGHRPRRSPARQRHQLPDRTRSEEVRRRPRQARQGDPRRAQGSRPLPGRRRRRARAW